MRKIFVYEVSEVSYILAVHTDASIDPMVRNVLDLVNEALRLRLSMRRSECSVSK